MTDKQIEVRDAKDVEVHLLDVAIPIIITFIIIKKTMPKACNNHIYSAVYFFPEYISGV